MRSHWEHLERIFGERIAKCRNCGHRMEETDCFRPMAALYECDACGWKEAMERLLLVPRHLEDDA